MADKKSSGGNPLVAGIAGAVIGAAAGVAAVALSDEKNRKKVGKFAQDLKTRGEGVMKDISESDFVQKVLPEGETSTPAKKKTSKKAK